MNRDEIGTQTCYIHQCTNKVMLMYIACLCPNLVSVHFYANGIESVTEIVEGLLRTYLSSSENCIKMNRDKIGTQTC